VNSGLAELDTPVPLVDVGRLDRNLRGMAEAVGGNAALRPHAKSHKTREVMERQRALGAVGVTVAKVGEAEAMVEAGADDVLIAYPVIGDRKYERLAPLLDRARIAIALDSPAVARAASDYFAPRDRRLRCLIEVDVGFGRCGVQSADEAVVLAAEMRELPGVELVGVMAFGGQAYRTDERAEQRAIGRREGELAVAVAQALRSAGHRIDSVSVGSTPTATAAAEVDGVTEVRPGVYAFCDLKQVTLGVADTGDCALTVLATVVSHPTPRRYVLDAGLKALAGEDYGWGTYGRLAERPDVVVSWAAEEHGVVDVPEGGPDPQLAIGDRVRIIPNHACGVVNMHDALVAIDGDAVIGTWPVVARGRVR
jgi:D-serine deaminase-like pyridoxal phosphate-dependent protein